MNKTVAVLFARSDSIYKSMPQCEVYDAERDAHSYTGNLPVIAHPPCKQWCRLRKQAKENPQEKALALWAVAQVRRYGGILEHPYPSELWKAAQLPRAGETDKHGGWTLALLQSDFGHKARKPTMLYIVGIEPQHIKPPMLTLGRASHVIATKKTTTSRPEVPRADREHTPEPMARWLIQVAEQCQIKQIKRDN